MRKFLIGLMALAMIGVACSNDDGAGASGPTGATSSETGATGTSPDPCAPESLNLLTAGTLTVGTDNPAFQPWFGGKKGEGEGPWEANPGFGQGNPYTGEGYEGTVAYDVAGRGSSVVRHESFAAALLLADDLAKRRC